MKNLIKRFVLNMLLVLLFVPSIASIPKEEQSYHISTEGNDQNSGTKNSPFNTLDHALEVVREQRNQGNADHIQITISAGTYHISNTINIDNELNNISIVSDQNGEVLFNGGRTISKEFIQVIETIDGSSKRYKVDLKGAGIHDYGNLRNVGFARPYGASWGEVFINKESMHLSRWPNKGMIPMGQVLDPGSVPRNDDFSNKGGVIRYDSARINSWANENDAWMSGYFMWGYADDMIKIASIDTVSKKITTASATMYGFGDGKPWRSWYGVNILAELDEAGEYYINRESGILYFISSEEKIEKLEFSILEDPFFAIEKVEDVTISGITFECSRGLGLALNNTNNVTIEDCSFRNLGSLGISIGKGIEPFDNYRHEGTGTPKANILGSMHTHLYSNTTFNREGGINNKITGCKFYNLGAGGVSLGGGNRLTLESGNNIVENCEFHDVNRIEKSYRPAVDLTGVGNKIRHCEIFNTPSMAIYIHGNNHLIEFNYIHDVCLEVEDQGAIYYGRDPSELGTMVRYNYFENIPGHYRTCAVYRDDGACAMTVTGNVFYKAGYWSSLIGGGSFNTYTNNIFIESNYGIHVDNRMQNWAKNQLDSGGIFEKRLEAVNYLQPPYSLQYPHLVSFLPEAAMPKMNVIDGNVFVDISKLIDGKKNWIDFKKNNLSAGSNIGFKDWNNKDFSLLENSIVFEKIKDFKPIPFYEIGLLK